MDLILYSVLIEHATAGLILYETGCHDDMEKHWGPVCEETKIPLSANELADSKFLKMYDSFPRKNYTSQNRLDKQIEATGHSIKDIKAVIMGHLRASIDVLYLENWVKKLTVDLDADHSGGLMHFIGTDVPIYVHDLELTNALWCLFTKVCSVLDQSSCTS